MTNTAGFDLIEERLRANVRATIEAVFEEELAGFLGRLRYGRGDGPVKGYRHGHRERQLTGTFGTETVRVPRARVEDEAGQVSEWRSKALPRYRRLTKKAEALIAAVYLSGTNTRRVKRALFGLFEGAVSKDVVSRAWRKVKVDWDAWRTRSLAGEDIVRLILDGTVIRTRLDRKATNISVLAAIGVRRDGQKVLLSIRNMGGESTAAWRQFLEDLDARGLKRPEFVIVDGAPGLEAALVALWGGRAADPALHGSQAPQPFGPCAETHAGRTDRGLPRHDLRRDLGGDRETAQGIPAQMAPQVPGGGRQPGGSRRSALQLHAP